MQAVLVVAFEFAACLGLGAAALKLLRVLPDLQAGDRYLWSFVLGFGLLGWLLFAIGAAGLFQTVPLLIFLGLCSAGVILLPAPVLARPEWGGLFGILLILAAMFVSSVDILEGLAPPADADTLAYHYALPKQSLSAGRLEFVPRAVDGAAPFLVQMSYVPALGLGGEQALVLWSMVTGWAPAVVLYGLAKPLIGARMSLAVALLLLTAPVVILSGGTGQVEIRNALFVMLAAKSVSLAIEKGQTRYMVLAGLCAGFFVGAKYLGLLFALACGLAILLYKGRIRNGAIYTVAVLIAGFQWYFWNWLHSGDPIFPFLIGIFGIGDLALWSPSFHVWFENSFFGSERVVPRTVPWLVAYPIAATFGLFRNFESARTGFGPYLVVVLPMVLYGIWLHRQRLISAPLAPIAAIVIFFYALWFFTGSSQRLRHLLPIYPIVLLLASHAAVRGAEIIGGKKTFAAVVLLVLAIQLGGQALYATNYARHHFTGETRDDFLRRNVPFYGTARWVNRNSVAGDRVMVRSRHLTYLIDAAPVYVAHQYHQALVDLRPQKLGVGRFLAQLEKLDINLIMHFAVQQSDGSSDPYDAMIGALLASQCASRLAEFPLRGFASRTLRLGGDSEHQGSAIRIHKYDCR